jgi:hypothetical protein
MNILVAAAAGSLLGCLVAAYIALWISWVPLL